jgi:uncharacterized protein
MNFDKLIKIFVPTDHAFFPLFNHASENLLKTAELLKEMVATEDHETHDRINRNIKELEHVGDEITNKVFDQVNKSFITPFDREDIHQLTSNMDDVIDSINGISRRICLYKPKKINKIFVEMADLIWQASKEIEVCIHNLEHAADKRNLIIDACKNVKSIEHRADELYFVGIQDIFDNEADPKEVIKNNKIIENLERCVDEAEDVTDIIQTILIKMA